MIFDIAAYLSGLLVYWPVGLRCAWRFWQSSQRSCG